MSVQRRSFFALKCERESWAEINPISDLSLCGGMPFTIHTYFMHTNSGKNVLLEQEGVFCLSIEDGLATYTADKLGSIRYAKGSGPQLIENEWNQIDIVYTGEKLQIYIQGILVQEYNAVGEKIINTDKRFCIGNMNGYMDEISIYSKALDATEIFSLTTKKDIDVQQTELSIDFGVRNFEDTGKNGFKIQLRRNCNIVNLMYGFVPSKYGYAIPFVTDKTNPGSFETGEFTILANVYPKTLTSEVYGGSIHDDETIIFSNGTRNTAQTIAIGMLNKTNNVFIDLGKTRLSFDNQLEMSKWHQVVATVSATDVQLYIDGENSGKKTLKTPFTRTEQPMVMIGNQLESRETNHGFMGYIDMVAVFDKELSSEKIKGYSDVAPYIYEDNLTALWLFSDQTSKNIKTEEEILFPNGTEGSTLLENTVKEETLSPFEFYMPTQMAEMSGMEDWLVRNSLNITLQCMEGLTGQKADGSITDANQKEIYSVIAQGICNSTSTNDFCAKMECLSDNKKQSQSFREDFVSILSSALAGGLLCTCVYACYATYQNEGYRRLRALKRFARFLKLGFWNYDLFAVGAAGGATVDRIVELAQKIKTPDPGECTEKDFKLTFKSVQFYNPDNCSMLLGKSDFDKDIILPEWSKQNDTVKSGDVLCYRNFGDGTPYVEVTFDCVNTCGIDVDITICGTAVIKDSYTDLLGTTQEQPVKVSGSHEYKVKFPLINNKIKEADLKAHNICWRWTYNDILWGQTEHRVHVIEDKPKSPWTTEEDSEHLPVFKMIETCHEIAKIEVQDKDPDERFASQFVKWIQGNTKIKATDWKDGNKYAAWCLDENRTLMFDVEKLAKSIKGGVTEIGELDCACMQLAYTRLEGLDKLKLLQLCPLIDTGDLFLRRARRIGMTEDDEYAILDSYHVCGISKEKEQPLIWDGFLKLQNSKDELIEISKLAFKEEEETQTDMIIDKKDVSYRSLLCVEGVTCVIAAKTSSFRIGILPNIKSIIYNSATSQIEDNGSRLNFDNRIIEHIALEPHEVRCHSISYKCIEDAIIENVNNYLSGEYIDLEKILSVLVEAVTYNQKYDGITYNPEYGDTEDKQELDDTIVFRKTAIDNAVKILNECQNFRAINNGTVSQNIINGKKKKIAKLANILLRALNNSPGNLRKGKSDWNSSIGELFDPKEWTHISAYQDDDGNKKLIYIQDTSNEGVFDDRTPIKELYGYDLIGSGFYFSDLGDCVRIKMLCTYRLAMSPTAMSALLDVKAGYLSAEQGDVTIKFPIIYSSSNKWKLKDYKITDTGIEGIQFHYLDGDNGWVAF